MCDELSHGVRVGVLGWLEREGFLGVDRVTVSECGAGRRDSDTNQPCSMAVECTSSEQILLLNRCSDLSVHVCTVSVV